MDSLKTNDQNRSSRTRDISFSNFTCQHPPQCNLVCHWVTSWTHAASSGASKSCTTTFFFYICSSTLIGKIGGIHLMTEGKDRKCIIKNFSNLQLPTFQLLDTVLGMLLTWQCSCTPNAATKVMASWSVLLIQWFTSIPMWPPSYWLGTSLFHSWCLSPHSQLSNKDTRWPKKFDKK